MTGVLHSALMASTYLNAAVVQSDFTTLTAYQTPSWLDNSGTTGNRTFTDSDGKITWAPANMLLRSQDFSATWTLSNATQTSGQTDPDGGSNAYTLAATAGNATIRQAVTTIANSYIFSVWLKRKTGTGNIDISVNGTTWATQSITSSWVRYSVSQTGVAGTSNPGIRIVTNGDEIYAYGAQLEAITFATSPGTYLSTTTAARYLPRYDYDSSTSPATARGILIEESRTNYALYSQTVTDASWTYNAFTLTSSNNSDPFGTNLAALATSSGGTGAHTIVNGASNVNYTLNATYTMSVFVKPNTATYIQLTLPSAKFGSGQYANFDLSGSGSVATVSGGSAAITPLSNGWFRISLTADATTAGGLSTSGAVVSISSGTDGRVPSVPASGSLYVVGWQLEQGAFATSYIPTFAASVTRAADVIKLADTALTTANANTGSAIVQTTLWRNSTAAVADLLSSATTRRLLYSNSSNTVLSSTDGTTRLDATIGSSGTFTGGAVRSAIGWNANGRSLIANSGTLAADTVNLSTGTTVTLGGYGTTTTFNGWVASMALYNQKLPNIVLKQKSVVGATY